MSKNAAQPKTQSSQPKPEPAVKHLEVFIGRWITEGQQYEGAVGPAAKITAVETFEWLEDDFFLIHRFDGRVGSSKAACIEIIGYNAQNRNYPTHIFYNNGLINKWQYHESDSTWTLTGDWDMAGKSMKARCTIRFSDGGESMVGKWEHSSDGSKWQAFWDVKATKVR